ncbi:hypothetical protein [Streptomyces chiangmaiensis]|uniref:Uncharacterized protein n=1 Tax=Streptomyces chiangmaiensis TaxID=766497 RepID=A0ABU7FUJ5_9ACTN|nr:hypothetical protein [Streptomyces chiangmaiensis]MED7827498.1 hypothetical protein [Streptomyces chiangmaiensis]
MEALLPSFVDQLLEHGQDPGEIPEISAIGRTGWLTALASRVVSVLSSETHGSADAFLAHGYAYLPVSVPDRHAVYLRVAAQSAMTPWLVDSPAVVLTAAGTVALEMYQEPSDMQAGRPQYARSFGPEQVFAVHSGTLCATQSSDDGLQVLAAHATLDTGERLSGDEYAAAAWRARWVLEELASAPVGGR